MKPKTKTKSKPIRKLKRRGQVVITTTVKKTGEEERSSQRRMTADDLPEFPAYVRVDGGLTKNLGNYNSAKLGVSISVPCHIDDKSMRDAYSRLSEMVEELIDEEYNKIEE